MRWPICKRVCLIRLTIFWKRKKSPTRSLFPMTAQQTAVKTLSNTFFVNIHIFILGKISIRGKLARLPLECYMRAADIFYSLIWIKQRRLRKSISYYHMYKASMILLSVRETLNAKARRGRGLLWHEAIFSFENY